MEIKKKFLAKYVHEIAVEQLSDEYKDKGYEVALHRMVESYNVDLVAHKGDETILVEVKSGKIKPSDKEFFKYISSYVKARPNHKFRLVVATPPREKRIDVPGFLQALQNYLMDEPLDELLELSYNTVFEGIGDYDIDSIEVQEGGVIQVSGNAVAEVLLQYGSESDRRNDDGYSVNSSFPFVFDISLEYSQGVLKVVDVDNIEFDTSSFYE